MERINLQYFSQFVAAINAAMAGRGVEAIREVDDPFAGKLILTKYWLMTIKYHFTQRLADVAKHRVCTNHQFPWPNFANGFWSHDFCSKLTPELRDIITDSWIRSVILTQIKCSCSTLVT